MFEDMLDDFMEMTSNSYSTWWASPPPPPPESLFYNVFGIGFNEFVSYLCSMYLGICGLVLLSMMFVTCLIQVIMLGMIPIL